MFASTFVGLTFCLTLIASCQSGAVGTVAFSAGVSANQGQVFETGVIVPYNRVYTNQGLGYNNSTGVFTAPKDGLYVFHYHALATRGQEIWLQLFQNNDWLVTVFAQIEGTHSHAANSIVRTLKKNDQVYVKAGRRSHIHCLPNEVHATFTGYQIGSLLDYLSTVE